MKYFYIVIGESEHPITFFNKISAFFNYTIQKYLSICGAEKFVSLMIKSFFSSL